MTTTAVARVAAGVPAGGQFTHGARDEADVTLCGNDTTSWPESLNVAEIEQWAAAGFSAADAHAWRSEWDQPLVLARHWRDSGFGPDDQLVEPGYRPLPFDDSPRDACYGPRESCTTQHPMLNRANITHLLDSFDHPEVYLELDSEETSFQAGSAYIAARICTHDGTQVGWLGREMARAEDGTWTLENHKLMLGSWDADRHELGSGPGLQGRGIGTAVAGHFETEIKRLMPETTRVATFSVSDTPGLRVGGYQNARRGFAWSPDHEAWDDARRAFVKMPPRKQLRAVWTNGGRDKIAGLRDAGHITTEQYAALEALMTATRGTVPTPRQLSELGKDAPFVLDGRITHLGKELLMGSEWHGTKPL